MKVVHTCEHSTRCLGSFESVFDDEQTTVYQMWYKAPSKSKLEVIVLGKNKERWEELCELASKEQDPTKLMELMKEIDRLLEIKLNRLKGVPPSNLKGVPPSK